MGRKKGVKHTRAHTCMFIRSITQGNKNRQGRRRRRRKRYGLAGAEGRRPDGSEHPWIFLWWGMEFSAITMLSDIQEHLVCMVYPSLIASAAPACLLSDPPSIRCSTSRHPEAASHRVHTTRATNAEASPRFLLQPHEFAGYQSQRKAADKHQTAEI